MHPIIKHLTAKGAVVSGRHSRLEIKAVEEHLSARLPEEFISYFSSFHKCDLPDSNWEFFDIPGCIERTLEYRNHYSRIHGTGFDLPTISVFAFCDYLIDAPTYLVVSEPTSPLFGYILGTHSEDGWIAGKNLTEFLKALERDWEIGIVMYEE